MEDYSLGFVLLLVLVLGPVVVFVCVYALRREKKLAAEAQASSDPQRALELHLDALRNWGFFAIHDTAGQVSKDLDRLELFTAEEQEQGL